MQAFLATEVAAIHNDRLNKFRTIHDDSQYIFISSAVMLGTIKQFIYLY